MKKDFIFDYKKLICGVLLCLSFTFSLFLTGCSSEMENTKLVFTTGFAKDEVFRIENESCKLPEIMVYLTNIQNRYENVYGDQIWNTEIDGVTLEDNIKEIALAKIAQIKAMNLLADEHGVELTEEDMELAGEAAREYYSSLNQTEISEMGVSPELVEQLYCENVRADRLYQYLIKDINPEISDDEARTITVEHILIKTYNLTPDGEKVEYTKYAKKVAKEIAVNVHRLAEDGEDFEMLASRYSEDDTLTYSFGKDEKEPAFEEAAFNLGKGEISDVIETQFGYHIIKCISTFNREVTEQNKEKIVEKRKKEVFGKEYEEFVLSLTKNLNGELWDEVGLIHNEAVDTSDFFNVYEKYFNDF